MKIIRYFLACREGWYGDNCSQQCVGHCRDNTTCNHVTGKCDKGCEAGWTGIFGDNGTFSVKKNNKQKIFMKFQKTVFDNIKRGH